MEEAVNSKTDEMMVVFAPLLQRGDFVHQKEGSFFGAWHKAGVVRLWGSFCVCVRVFVIDT